MSVCMKLHENVCTVGGIIKWFSILLEKLGITFFIRCVLWSLIFLSWLSPFIHINHVKVFRKQKDSHSLQLVFSDACLQKPEAGKGKCS